MKHTQKQSKKAKERLITSYKYKECDFYLDQDGLYRIMVKDEADLYAFDVCQDLKYRGEDEEQNVEWYLKTD